MIRYTKEYISKLLTRFMDGETSIGEEDVLNEYFRTAEDVPEEWRDYQEMFAEWNIPQPVQKEKKKRWRWFSVAAAAAAVLLLLYVAMPSQHMEQPTIAQAIEEPHDSVHVQPDTIATPAPKPETPPRRKRRPRIHDAARNYTLLAELEQQRVEQEIADMQEEIERIQLEVLDAQLRAQGYVALRYEDGTIEYKKENEQSEYYAYEPD